MGYDVTSLVIGPNIGLYWDTTIPASGTQLALDANGHPSDGVLLGYTDRGAVLNIGWAAPPEEAWDNQEGYRVVHCDVVDRSRRHGKSNYGIFDRGLQGALDLGGVWWLRRRRRRMPKVEEIKRV